MISPQRTLSQFYTSEVCLSHELVEATHNYHVPVREHLGGAYLGPTLRCEISDSSWRRKVGKLKIVTNLPGLRNALEEFQICRVATIEY